MIQFNKDSRKGKAQLRWNFLPGISEANPAGSRWKRISGKAKQCSVFGSTNTIWCVNANDHIFHYRPGSLKRNLHCCLYFLIEFSVTAFDLFCFILFYLAIWRTKFAALKFKYLKQISRFKWDILVKY